jgi:hypothetical protein
MSEMKTFDWRFKCPFERLENPAAESGFERRRFDDIKIFRLHRDARHSGC